jgi:hypothetical protein
MVSIKIKTADWRVIRWYAEGEPRQVTPVPKGPEVEFLEEIQTEVFLLAIHRHLY